MACSKSYRNSGRLILNRSINEVLARHSSRAVAEYHVRAPRPDMCLKTREELDQRTEVMVWADIPVKGTRWSFSSIDFIGAMLRSLNPRKRWIIMETCGRSGRHRRPQVLCTVEQCMKAWNSIDWSVSGLCDSRRATGCNEGIEESFRRCR